MSWIKPPGGFDSETMRTITILAWPFALARTLRRRLATTVWHLWPPHRARGPAFLTTPIRGGKRSCHFPTRLVAVPVALLIDLSRPVFLSSLGGTYAAARLRFAP